MIFIKSANLLVVDYFHDDGEISWFSLIFVKSAKCHGLLIFQEVGKISFLSIFMSHGSWFFSYFMVFSYFALNFACMLLLN